MNVRLKFMAAMLAAVTLFNALSYERIDFNSKPMTAGRALLTENAFVLPLTLDVAHFAPELEFPIQLIYKSNQIEEGIFGYGWHSPQLESRVIPENDGLLWVTPWGEKIKFYTVKKVAKSIFSPDREITYGPFTPYSDWEVAEARGADAPALDSGNWTFAGRRQKKGWRIEYKNGRLSAITAPTTRRLEFVYRNKDLQSIKLNGVNFVEIFYNARLADSITINGRRNFLDYDKSNVRIMPITAAGKVVNVKRPLLSKLTQGKAPAVKFGYNTDGYLAKISAGGQERNFEVLSESEEDYKAALERKEPGISGRLLKEDDLNYVYTGRIPGNIALINNDGKKAEYSYQPNEGIFKIKDLAGRETTITYYMLYDVAYLGKTKAVVDYKGNVISAMKYDKDSGDLISVTDYLGNETLRTYDNSGNLLTLRRRIHGLPPEPLVNFTYDMRNNLLATAILNQAGEAVMSIRRSYDKFNQLTEIKDGRQNQALIYNANGYPTELLNTFGQKITREYDLYNRLIAVTDSNGVTTRFRFNSDNQLKRMERHLNGKMLSFIEISYDEYGREISYTDERGLTKRRELDDLGRIKREFMPDDSVLEFDYTENGKVAKVHDQNGNVINFNWRGNELLGKTTPAGQVTDYVRDDSGLLLEVKSRFAESENVDRSIKYEYDKFDRKIKTIYDAEHSESYKYDLLGRISELEKISGKEVRKSEFSYDYFGRLIIKRNTLNGKEDSMALYSYNPWGQREKLTVRTDGKSWTEERTYDKFGRLASQKSPSGTAEYQYNAANQLECRTINGMPEYYTYTELGMLKSKRIGKFTASHFTLK